MAPIIIIHGKRDIKSVIYITASNPRVYEHQIFLIFLLMIQLLSLLRKKICYSYTYSIYIPNSQKYPKRDYEDDIRNELMILIQKFLSSQNWTWLYWGEGLVACLFFQNNLCLKYKRFFASDPFSLLYLQSVLRIRLEVQYCPSQWLLWTTTVSTIISSW